MVAGAATGLVGTILLLSRDWTLVVDYMIATAAGFLMLRLVAWLMMAAARRSMLARAPPRMSRTLWRSPAALMRGADQRRAPPPARPKQALMQRQSLLRLSALL